MTAPSPPLAVALFIALLATGIALGPALAHLLEMPNKMKLTDDDYFIVQRIYYGWSLLAVVLSIQLAAMIAAAFLGRAEPSVLIPVLIAIAALVFSQVAFWIWTYPANTATEQWTIMPQNYRQLRTQWEYSHAAGAILQLIALCALAFAAVGPFWRGQIT